jgi:hydrogenase expression/formation protein HypD
MIVKHNDKYLSDILANLKRFSGLKVNIMEVCGTHTMAISRYGIRSILPGGVRLISGPGCPVCVTEPGVISLAIQFAEDGITVATFGDMMRVPSSKSSLQEARARGADIRVVYSPLDVVDILTASPDIELCFFAVGFETTAPAVALLLEKAIELRLKNFSMLTSLRTIPPAMEEIAKDGSAKVNGFIAPGHVSVVIGSKAYMKIARDYGIPSVISGFSASDIIKSIDMLLDMIKNRQRGVKIQYSSVVDEDGNKRALNIIDKYFILSDISWRGLGNIKGSGLKIRPEYSDYDALVKFGIEVESEEEPDNCLCGDVISGKVVPTDCALFGILCSPEKPVGPCMVSSEGTCSAYYKYGDGRIDIEVRE